MEKCNYRVKYKETKEILKDICKVFNLEHNTIIYKLVVAAGGAAVIVMYLLFGNPQALTAGGMAALAVKYVIWWAAAFCIGWLYSKTLGIKWALLVSESDGEDMYKIRMAERKEPLEVSMEFYEDRFVNVTKTSRREFLYKNVLKLIETDEAMGIVVRRDSGEKSFYGFRKESLESDDIEGFKGFLTDRCSGVKDGFKVLSSK